jgi:hypothetical protein
VNYVIVNIAALVLASSISYSNLSVGSNDQMLRATPPPPAPPVAAELGDEEETFTVVAAD